MAENSSSSFPDKSKRCDKSTPRACAAERKRRRKSEKTKSRKERKSRLRWRRRLHLSPSFAFRRQASSRPNPPAARTSPSLFRHKRDTRKRFAARARRQQTRPPCSFRMRGRVVRATAKPAKTAATPRRIADKNFRLGNLDCRKKDI